MRYYLSQNLSIIIAAISVFILSLSMGLLIYKHSYQESKKASVINLEELSPHHFERLNEGF